MAEENQANANPPASSGGITQDQLNAAVAAALKPLQDELVAIRGDQKVLADTMAKLPPAAPAKKETPDVHPGLTEERLLEILGERDQKQAKTAARQKVVDELKAKGVADEVIAAHVPDTDDAAALTAAADKAVARWNEIGPKAPDLGGAAKDGGKKPGEGDVPAKVFHGLSDGVAKYAAELHMPGAPAQAK